MLKKVLFVGLGSAGQRHLRNLLTLSGGEIEVSAYRFHKSERVFTSNMQVQEGRTLAEQYKIKEFDRYEDALKGKPDAVIIANPNSLHVPYALQAARAGVDLFVEKPLGTALEQAQELISEIDRNGVVCQVGYQYRFHPCLQLTKRFLSEGKLGGVVSARMEIGERISRMHSYEDYRGMAEARKELGGGVVLCQSHELDYITWLFGEPDTVRSIGGKRSEFDLDVEDTATTFLEYKREDSEFAVILHQDYLQYPPVRTCKIIGTAGKIELDLLRPAFIYDCYETGEHQEHVFSSFDRNDMFLEELKEFLNCVEKREKPSCGICDAMASLRIGLAIKESFTERKEIRLCDV